jgi:hypothetical protein
MQPGPTIWVLRSTQVCTAQHSGPFRSVGCQRNPPSRPAGYGHAPTAYVYTSADTVLPTTHYQTPLAAFGPAAAAPRAAAQPPSTADMTSRGRLLQAFTFSAASGSSLHGSSSTSASPLDRTLLYTRSGHSQGDAGLQNAAAVDLLDRMTLLRRMAPATVPAARPPQLAPAAQPAQHQRLQSAGRHTGHHHFTPAPQHVSPRRWAWDDSGACSSSHARPIAHVPAPGWRYCGDVVAAAATDGGEVSVLVAQEGGSGRCSSPLRGAAATDGGAEQREGHGADEVVVVVRSPRAHQLSADEWEGHGLGQAELEADSSTWSAQGSRKPAFRPPGPLQHKFGNRPRPRSALSAAERDAREARAAGLRECGCPRSPRGPVDGAWHSGGRGKQLRWQDEMGAPAEGTASSSPDQVLTCGASSCPSLEPAISHQERARKPARHAATSSTAAACGCTPGATTTTVEVTGPDGTDALVISSPAAAASLGAGERGTLLVACASPRCSAAAAVSGAAGGGTVEVVVAQLAALRPAAASAEQAGLTSKAPRKEPAVRHPMKAGHDCRGHGIRSGAASPAASDGGREAPAGIQAWRPGQAPNTAQRERRCGDPAGGGLAVEVEVLLSPRPAFDGTDEQRGEEQQQGHHATGEQQEEQHEAHAQLQLLSGEMRRRERSFAQLLGELERITLKCSKLTAAADAAITTSTPAGEAASGASSGDAACSRQRQQLHTTHLFNAGHPAAAAKPSNQSPQSQPAAAASPSSSSPAAPAEAGRQAGEWSWESLLAFEQTIREQQRKVRRSGQVVGSWFTCASLQRGALTAQIWCWLLAAGGAGCAAGRVCMSAQQTQQQQHWRRWAATGPTAEASTRQTDWRALSEQSKGCNQWGARAGRRQSSRGRGQQEALQGGGAGVAAARQGGGLLGCRRGRRAALQPQGGQLLQEGLPCEQIGGAVNDVLGGGLRAAGPAAAARRGRGRRGGGGVRWGKPTREWRADTRPQVRQLWCRGDWSAASASGCLHPPAAHLSDSYSR